jgi:Raf kinase inhibitor-like YbhB/YbcL family protein
LALVASLAGYGSEGRRTVSLAPELTVAGSIAESPADGPLEISSPAFEDGAPIPFQFTCEGPNISPPLTWSAPLGGALVVDDPDAVGGPYIHWIVIGIPPGPANLVNGEVPPGGTELLNSAGKASYTGPCPVAGTGIHHYRFTLYQLPATLQLPPGLGGLKAAQEIARATTAQAQITGTFER